MMRIKIHLIGQQVVGERQQRIRCTKSLFRSGNAAKDKMQHLLPCWYKGTPSAFKSRPLLDHFYFCVLPRFSLCCLLLPANAAQYVAAAEAKRETIVFSWLSQFLQFNLDFRHKESGWCISSCWRQEGFLLFVRHREVVFQTRDYAHCDLPKHTVLAIFSWKSHESHFET